MFFSSSATCFCTMVRNALNASTSGAPSSVVSDVDLLLHGGVGDRRTLDHVGVAEDLAHHRVERGLFGVVVRLELADHLTDDRCVGGVVELCEQRIHAAVIGEYEVNSVRHFRPPVPGHGWGAVAARSQWRCTERSATTLLANLLFAFGAIDTPGPAMSMPALTSRSSPSPQAAMGLKCR